MAGSSYAVKRDTLSPTMALIARIIDNTAEKSIAFTKLEQILFLADWKLAQATGRPSVETGWIHDNEHVTAFSLFQMLLDDNHFVLTNQKAAKSARVAMARKFDFSLPLEVEQAIGVHIQFLDGQPPSALRNMIKDCYPVRSSRPGKRFALDDRLLAYKQSKRIHA